MQAVARPLWKMHSVIDLWNDKSCKDIFPIPAVSGCFWCLYMQGNSLRQRFVVTRLFRSSNRRCSVNVFLEISQNSQKKHLCQSLLFNNVAGLKPETLLKKRLWHRCFSVSFAKFLTTPFLQNTSERLLLFIYCKSFFLFVHQIDVN